MSLCVIFCEALVPYYDIQPQNVKEHHEIPLDNIKSAKSIHNWVRYGQ